MEDTTRFSPTKPHFFKPLINPDFLNEILIPASFFKYLEGQSCEKAVLRSGRGGGKLLWPVNLNGRRIVEGWPKFVKDHDLHIGDFLVFKHEGKMVFDVIIFDPSACEREYPPLDFIDEVVDLVEENGSKVIGKRKYPKTTYEANATFLPPTKNPYFVATLKPSYMRSRIMMIPADFSRKHLLRNGYREVTLRDQKQKSWRVGLRSKKGRNEFYFGPGWHDFSVANRLREGDSFMFELIKNGNELIMNFLYKSAPGFNAKASSSKGLERSCMSSQKMTSKAKTTSYTPGDSSFCGIIRPSHLTKYHMKLPIDFVKSNGLSEESNKMIVLKNKNEGSWQVFLRHQKCYGQVYIGRGWNEFAVENDLEVGDKFKMEIIKEGNMLFMNYYGANDIGEHCGGFCDQA